MVINSKHNIIFCSCKLHSIVFVFFVKRFVLDTYDMTGHTISRPSIFIWRHITPMLLILAFSSILTVGILDGFRYEVWTYGSVSIEYDIFYIYDNRLYLKYFVVKLVNFKYLSKRHFFCK